jgi:hypothetical protein
MRPIPLNIPKAVKVVVGRTGVPSRVEGVTVDQVREEWLVEDGWWCGEPTARRYFELLLTDGRIEVVFCDTDSNRWFSQRA